MSERTPQATRLVLAATAAVRGAAVLIVGLDLVLGAQATGATRAVQLGCFTVGTAGVLAWGALAARRPGRVDNPLLAVFVVMAATAGGAAGAHGAALVLFALIATAGTGAGRGLVAAWTVAGIGIFAVTVGAVATDATPTTALGASLELAVALLYGRGRRSYRVRAEQSALLLEQAEALRVEQARVVTLDERARIAREIHDVLAHSLGALGIQVQAARAVLTEQRDVDAALTVLDRAQRIATEGLSETRRAVHALRTDSRPLPDELAALAADHRAMHGPVDLAVHGAAAPLAPQAALALLRVAQESLVNAAKHAPGQPVALTLTYDDACARLEVANPLPRRGSPVATQVRTIDGGYGLRGMRERLLLLRGTLTAHEAAGRWDVTAQVPR